MKKLLFILLGFGGIVLSHAQQILDLHSGILNNAMTSTVPTRDIEELTDGYLITYSFDNALVQPDNLFSGTVFWKMDGFGLNEVPGDPSTLLRNDLVAVPSGYVAEVEMVDCAYRDFSYELTPARQPLLNSSNEGYTKQNVLAIKPYSGFKPANVVSVSENQSYRGHEICQTTVSPIQYNYNTKTVRAYTSIKYKITFVQNDLDGNTGGTMPGYILPDDYFLSNNVVIGGQKEANRAKAASAVSTPVPGYLVLSTNEYAAAANRFAEWKRLLGFTVHVVLKDSWTCQDVKYEVGYAYANSPALYYMLIIGDHDDIPAQQSTLKLSHVTDYYYGCIDEDDLFPEVYCGRLPVSTSDEAMTVVEKIINYEQTPPESPAFYEKGLHCAYFQDTDNHDGYADRRFAQTSEDVRTYVMSQGKTLQRVYTTKANVTPLHWNYGKYSYGEDIPDELRKPGFAWNGNSTDITNAINAGVFYVLHRDHGAVYGWGDPLYTQQNISSLSNGNLLPIVFSMNCLTGKFDENCFAETFLRKSNGGCVAIYAASQTSYSGYNDALTTGMFDAIWPTPGLAINIPKKNGNFSVTPVPTYTLGQILDQGMFRMAETYGLNNGYVIYTKEIFHCFGDPSMKIYTDAPTAFVNVSIKRNTNSISVSIGESDPVKITAYNPATGSVQSYLGNSVTITTDPSTTIVCVSAHNRIPFIQYPDVMYIQNKNITGTLEETHDIIKVGNHVTTAMDAGDVTTSNANIALKANNALLDSGTYISLGSTLRISNP